jgi:hypothetical protein
VRRHHYCRGFRALGVASSHSVISFVLIPSRTLFAHTFSVVTQVTMRSVRDEIQQPKRHLVESHLCAGFKLAGCGFKMMLEQQ